MPKPPEKPTGRKKLHAGEYACQYRVHDSAVHRLGAGWKLLLGTGLSAAAVAAREPWQLAGILVLTLTYYFAARLSPYDLWRDLRFFVLQATIIISLYCLYYGIREGSWPGIRTSLQLVLAFIPGIVFLRTTKATALMRGLRRILPYQLSFLLSTSLRFVPFFARELSEIAMAQKLRGAKLSPREVINPRNWQDLFHCLLLPLMIRALKTADEAALSAEARGFGSQKKRTYWDPQPGKAEEDPAGHKKCILEAK